MTNSALAFVPASHPCAKCGNEKEWRDCYNCAINYNGEDEVKFRKKPVVIEATQFNHAGDHPNVIVAAKTEAGEIRMMGGGRPCFALKTLEGWHEVSQGDWIITGVKGEQYPCKPDIFEATYERAE